MHLVNDCFGGLLRPSRLLISKNVNRMQSQLLESTYQSLGSFHEYSWLPFLTR